MSAIEDNDYRKKACPKCGNVGSVHLDISTSRFRCSKCLETNFDPFQGEEKPPTKKELEPEIVLDTCLDPVSKKKYVVKMYCPKEEPEAVLDLNVNDNRVKFIKARLRKTVAKEKRYRRDTLRKYGQRPVNILDEVRTLCEKK